MLQEYTICSFNETRASTSLITFLCPFHDFCPTDPLSSEAFFDKRNQRIGFDARVPQPVLRSEDKKIKRKGSSSCEFSGSLGGTFIVIPDASSIVRHRRRILFICAELPSRPTLIYRRYITQARYHRAEPIKRLEREKEKKGRSVTFSTPRFRKWMADERFQLSRQ